MKYTILHGADKNDGTCFLEFNYNISARCKMKLQ